MSSPRKYLFKNICTSKVYVKELRFTLDPGQTREYEGVLHERTPFLKGKFLDIQDLGPSSLPDDTPKRAYVKPPVFDRPTKGKAEAVKFVDNLEEKPDLVEVKVEIPVVQERVEVNLTLPVEPAEVEVPTPLNHVDVVLDRPVEASKVAEEVNRLDKLMQDNPYTVRKGKGRKGG